ncbi:MAG: NADH-quinone oxidoreductase subunit H, partial [Myxococcales bacterium]
MPRLVRNRAGASAGVGPLRRESRCRSGACAGGATRQGRGGLRRKVADLLVHTVRCLAVILIVLQTAALLLWLERKGSALIHNRVGANRANFIGVLPFNLGIVNTLVADPVKLFTKEDFVPAGADHFVHTLAPFLALFPAIVTFAAIPFGDVLHVGDRVIELRAVSLDFGILYMVAMISVGVYGVVLAGWASNNRWSLLGGIRGSAQMISYEVALGIALASVILTSGTLDMQEMVRAQGSYILGVIPAWGIFYQPVAFLLIFTAGMAETKRVPFDLPEAESELIVGYFTEYSGGKQAAFMLADFAE